MSEQNFTCDCCDKPLSECENSVRVNALVMCADCRFWDGVRGAIGKCEKLPDQSFVYIYEGDDRRAAPEIKTSDDFGCALGERT